MDLEMAIIQMIIDDTFLMFTLNIDCEYSL